MITIYDILVLATAVLFIGVFGTLINRTNIMILFMSFEIMYLASFILIAFTCYMAHDIMGAVMLIYVLTVVGAESCIGLAIIAAKNNLDKNVSLNTMDAQSR